MKETKEKTEVISSKAQIQIDLFTKAKLDAEWQVKYHTEELKKSTNKLNDLTELLSSLN